MTSKKEIVNYILDKAQHNNISEYGEAFAPSNIALVKYWGKINNDLNIPYTDSLSISLGDLGASTKIFIYNQDDIKKNNIKKDIVYLNNKLIETNTEFYTRIVEFLDLFRNNNIYYKIETNSNIPVAAGVASSACGFAALVLALNNLYNWNLSKQDLSILARLGSGSASRSLWQGFVYWQRGNNIDGMDSYSFKLDYEWPELYLGLIILSDSKKYISSGEAMKKTMETSVLYQNGWNEQVSKDLVLIKQAILNKNLKLLGETAENNSLAMHATMLSAKPGILYSTQNTIEIINQVWQLRKNGIEVYFTQDAGPNIKLIFDKNNLNIIKKYFENIIIINPWSKIN